MYRFSTHPAGRKTTLLFLLLLSLPLSPLVSGMNMNLATSGTHPNVVFKDQFNSVSVNLQTPLFLRFTNSQIYNGMVTFYFPRAKSGLTLACSNFVANNGGFRLAGNTMGTSVFNFTVGLATYKLTSLAALFAFSFGFTSGNTLYIRDITISGDTISSAVMLDSHLVGNSPCGLYISNLKNYVSRTVVRSILNTNSFVTVALDHVTCTACANAFFVAENSKFSEGLIRFDNCNQATNAPFFKLTNGLVFNSNANLVFSEVTSTAALFHTDNNGQVGLAAFSRITLYKVVTGSLFGGKGLTFPALPAGVQIYLGPITINRFEYKTQNDYNKIGFPYTRVIDENRRVLYLSARGARSGDVGDTSTVGQFSASHCVNNGYSRIGWMKDTPRSPERVRCVCHPDRFVPHCTNTWDPLGISLCQTNTTRSLTSGLCVACTVSNCDHCNEANKCARCLDGYIADAKGGCMKADPNCVEYNQVKPEICDKCKTGFSPSINGKCVKTIPNCIKYTDNGVCLDCSGNLIPSADGDACIECNVPKCEVCSAYDKCTRCKPDYSLSNYRCYTCEVEHCVFCNADNKCARCEANHMLTLDKQCTFIIPNCKSYYADGLCKECKKGYIVSSDKQKCFTVIENCEEYQTDGTCLKCKGELTPSADGFSCVNCTVENCAICNTEGECIACEENYSPVNNTCISCNVPNCAFCYEEDVCGYCIPGSNCEIGKSQDTSKGIPWWVWLIVGLGAAVVVGLIIFFIVWCFCCKQEEYFVTYQEGYNEVEEKNGDRDMRLWDRNGDISGDEHGAMFMMNDGRRPRVFKQDENTTHGDGSSFASSDNSSSSSSRSTTSESDNSSDSEDSR